MPELPRTAIISPLWDPLAREQEAERDFQRHLSAQVQQEAADRYGFRKARVLADRAMGWQARKAARIKAARLLLIRQTSEAVDCLLQALQSTCDDYCLVLDARHVALRALHLAGADCDGWWAVDASDASIHHPWADILKVLRSIELPPAQRRILEDAVNSRDVTPAEIVRRDHDHLRELYGERRF